jgi:hypothetical protein
LAKTKKYSEVGDRRLGHTRDYTVWWGKPHHVEDFLNHVPRDGRRREMARGSTLANYAINRGNCPVL